MSLGRAVPWISWEEWRQVGNWLQSQDGSLIQQGLDRVAAWRARGRVPLGVDATACIVETRMGDNDPSACTSSIPNELALRMQYSLAIVRLVNGIADSSQKGRVAASVAHLSAAAGIPRLLVDLRHEATHNELPSLSVLRLAAQHALSWLETNYWLKQDENIHTLHKRISDLIGQFITSHVAAASKAAAALKRQHREEYADDSGCEEQSDMEDETGDDLQPKYKVTTARKQRQALLTELKTLVPVPVADVLVDGLFESVAELTTTEGTMVVQQALTNALPHLYAEWSQLPQLLLERLLQEAAKVPPTADQQEPTTTERSTTDDSFDVWIHVLLKADDEYSSKELKHGATAKALLAMALAALADATSQLLFSNKIHRHFSDTNKGFKVIETCIEWFCSNSIEDQELVAKCRQVVGDYQVLAGNTSSPGTKQMAVEEMAIGDGSGKREIEENEEEEKQGDLETSRPKKQQRMNWMVSTTWKHACALGMLPSAIHINGKSPALDIEINKDVAIDTGGGQAVESWDELEPESEDRAEENGDGDDIDIHIDQTRGASKCRPPPKTIVSLF